MSINARDGASNINQTNIVSQGDTLKSPITSSNKPLVKYITDKTREQVSVECSKASSIKGMANVSFGLGGTALVLLLGCLKLAAVSAAAASMVTPVGWAIAGLVMLGIAILAVRHLYMKNHNIDSAPGSAAWSGIKSFAWPIAVAVAIGGGGTISNGRDKTIPLKERMKNGNIEVLFHGTEKIDSTLHSQLHQKAPEWEAPFISKEGELIIYKDEQLQSSHMLDTNEPNKPTLPEEIHTTFKIQPKKQ